jgi:hypothetical protein
MRRQERAPKGFFHHAKWHDWVVCRSCGGLVEDWGLHMPCPVTELEELRERLGMGADREACMNEMEAAAVARAEGNAVVEASAWQQIRGIFRLKPAKNGGWNGADWPQIRRSISTANDSS